MTYTVYHIRHLDTGCVYYGVTTDLPYRWSNHLSAMRCGIQSPLYEAMRHYGACRYECVALSSYPSADLAALCERRWIARSQGRCYNVTRGGDSVGVVKRIMAQLLQGYDRDSLG